MAKELNFEGLARLLLSQSRDILYKWLPGGRLVGNEWTCADLTGTKGDSLKVNINTGVWKDFAGNEKGGDLVSLYAAINKKKQGEAFHELAQDFSFEQNGSENPGKAIVKQETEVCQPPLDQDLSKPLEMFKHRDYGRPSSVWWYRNIMGEVLFAIARYESEEGKQILPWTWNKRGFWNCKGWPAPRPLFGLEYLKEQGDRKIMIVEGEKAAVAAREIVGHRYIVLTWPNGAQAWEKADWSPISGQEIVLWADNDKVGKEVMPNIAEKLAMTNKKVRLIDPSGKSDGWDAADALMEGMTWDLFKEWAKDRVSEYKTPAQIITATAIAEAKKEEVTAIAGAKAEVTNIINIEDAPIIDKEASKLWEELGLTMTKSYYPNVNYHNVVRCLKFHKPFNDIVWFDEFHGKFFTKWGSGERREWTDYDDAVLAIYFQDKLGMTKMNRDCIQTGINVYARENKKNEVKEWLGSLEWDGKERISHFFETYYGSDYNSYTHKAAMNFWIGMVARVHNPGCKLDNMIVLEGAQGIGKSRSMQIIGGDWYAEASESVQGKDFYLVLKGKLLIEIAELDSFGKADVTRIKQTISCPKDTYRAPYEARPKDHYRQSVFVGTTNDECYLRDTTGGRRFWPIMARKIDLQAIARDREQLFAQACKQFAQGDEWWIMPVDETLKEQDSRRQRDDWEQVIEAYIGRREVITGVEIATECLKIDIGKFDKQLQMRVANILKSLKWKREKIWDPVKMTQIRIWKAPSD